MSELRGTPARRPVTVTGTRKPEWVKLEEARREYGRVTIAFGNQEATMTELVAAAEKLRALQQQWKSV